MTDVHSCSYYCDRPECIKAQRDELRERLAQPEQEPVAFEEWLSKQHGDPEEIGFLQALRIAYISGQDSITTPPQLERHELQAKGEHPAPCARHCEANAFQIVIKNLKAQLAQPEQKPVAWPCLIAEADFSEDTVLLKMQCTDYKVSAGKHWLYTAPPQRKPLLASDIVTMYDENPRSDSEMIAFARAIEAAHGIKGEA